MLPPLAEQKRITEVLVATDTAIERTRAVIAQVRVVKQALLADLMTNGLPGRHKKFKTVKGIGRMPAKWRVVLFEEAVKRITYGFTNPMPTTDEGPYMVTAKNVEDGYINYGETRRTDWDA